MKAGWFWEGETRNMGHLPLMAEAGRPMSSSVLEFWDNGLEGNESSARFEIQREREVNLIEDASGLERSMEGYYWDNIGAIITKIPHIKATRNQSSGRYPSNSRQAYLLELERRVNWQWALITIPILVALAEIYPGRDETTQSEQFQQLCSAWALQRLVVAALSVQYNKTTTF